MPIFLPVQKQRRTATGETQLLAETIKLIAHKALVVVQAACSQGQIGQHPVLSGAAQMQTEGGRCRRAPACMFSPKAMRILGRFLQGLGKQPGAASQLPEALIQFRPAR